MAKDTITALEQKFGELPRSISFEKHIRPILQKAGISARTFHRDLKKPGNTIPPKRLQVYASLFDCNVSDFIEKPSHKINPLVKRSIGEKVGLKS
jgi:hypothetical protein